MARKQVQAQENISPNLVPMVDIIFLMLLFFMLGADMGQRELEEVKVPLARAVQDDKDDDLHEKNPRIVANVFHDFEGCPTYNNDKLPEAQQICPIEDHWKIGIKGHEWNRLGEPIAPNKTTLHDYLLAEAELERDPENVSNSLRKVIIRADKAALYGYVQRVMNACAEVGIYKVEIGAAQVVDEGAPAKAE